MTTVYENYENSAEQIEGGRYWVEPNLREDAIILREQWYMGDSANHDVRSLLRQVPLHLEDRSLVAGRGLPE